MENIRGRETSFNIVTFCGRGGRAKMHPSLIHRENGLLVPSLPMVTDILLRE